ncbi:MAG TPA: AIR synthase related protein [Streptosporangiaceae bacterium]|nr:AIR synthase related protein [Streptosporangiaceae bacterium]
MPLQAEELAVLVRRIRDLPGVRAKRAIGTVADVLGGGDWWAGPGDDGAVVEDDGRLLIVGGEAMLPAFVASDPYGAGIGAMVANVNDLAAMGARPLAVVDTLVGPARVCREILRGMRWAAERYDVPVVGGHLTESDGPPAFSAFGLGRANAVLSATHTEPGHALVVAACVSGEMRDDFLFFRSFEHQGFRLAADVRLLAEIAESGAAVAAKDVSMAGMVGSLAMLLEANRLGVTLDLEAVPVPPGVSLGDWLCCFPSYAFVLTGPARRAGECVAMFADRGLAAAVAGELDESGAVRLASGGAAAVAFDLRAEAVTRLAR